MDLEGILVSSVFIGQRLHVLTGVRLGGIFDIFGVLRLCFVGSFFIGIS